MNGTEGTFELTVKSSGHKKLAWLISLMVVVALGAYSYTTIKEAQYLSPSVATISVSGTGEVFARPDVALFNFTVRAEGDDAGSAQEKSATAVNAIIAFLRDEGIEERDIKTENYNLSPRYEYIESICSRTGYCPPGERVLRGYEVWQTVSVKVRATDTAGGLISGVGERGATDVSNLQFTIDDEEVLKDDARKRAIDKAKEKAQVLADELGVSLVRIVSFTEDGGGYEPYFRAETATLDAVGGGVAPELPVGENTITSRVQITYEVR